MDTEHFRGYQLLEYFDDTILFEYDQQRDIIYFTPQIRLYIDVKECRIPYFSKCFQQYIPIIKEQEYVQLLIQGQRQSPFKLRCIYRKHMPIWFYIDFKYEYRQEQLFIIGKMLNIHDFQRDNENLIQMAQKDGLTGVYNRMTLEKLLLKRLHTCQYGVVMMMDINGFKKINDDYGHIYGDKVLKWVANTLQQLFFKSDILGRAGGDEFFAFMEDRISNTDIEERVMSIQEALKNNPFKINELSVSIGISFYPDDGQTYDSLYDKADRAMYQAKNENLRYCYFKKN